ncbi:MAG: thiol:disulfide interchange protein DsbA/DsbL [Pseudomonadota bacterium]
MKRFFSTCILVLVGTLASTHAPAQDYVEGTHYTLITPALRTSSAEKIEVVEFFAYSCGHCYTFEPLLRKWASQQPEDVVVAPSPVIWNDAFRPHARAFYAAQALGVLDAVHGAIFAAIHVDRQRLSSDSQIKKVFVDNGVSPADFDKAFTSFGVGSQVQQAESRARSARVAGTPGLMVAGKYRINARDAGGHANMLKIAEYLVEKERAAAAG